MRRRRVAVIYAPAWRSDIGIDRVVAERAAGVVRGGLDALGLELEPSWGMRARKLWREVRHGKKGGSK